MNTSTSTIASREYAASIPSGTRNCPSQPFGDVQIRVHQPGDRRRQRERQIDERIEQPLAGELVADQHPGDEQPEHDADRCRDERRAERRARRRPAAARSTPRRGTAPSESCVAVTTHAPSGIQHQHAQVQQREAEAQPVAGQDSRVRPCHRIPRSGSWTLTADWFIIIRVNLVGELSVGSKSHAPDTA